MRYLLLMMNGMAYEIGRDSYDAFIKDRNNPDILFHDFRDVKGVLHSVAKMGILSVALESGLAVKLAM